MAGEEVVVGQVKVTGATGDTGERGERGETGPRGLPPMMDEQQAHRIDSVIAFARNVLVLVVVVAALGAFAISAVFGRLGSIQESQAAGRVRTYQTRSVNCVALLLAPTMHLPGDCTDDDVLPYVCRSAMQTGQADWVARIETQTGARCRFPSS